MSKFYKVSKSVNYARMIGLVQTESKDYHEYIFTRIPELDELEETAKNA